MNTEMDVRRFFGKIATTMPTPAATQDNGIVCEICKVVVDDDDYVGCCRDGECSHRVESMCRRCAVWNDETGQWSCDKCVEEDEEEDEWEHTRAALKEREFFKTAEKEWSEMVDKYVAKYVAMGMPEETARVKCLENNPNPKAWLVKTDSCLPGDR